MFTEKTAETLSAMNAEELAGYYKEKMAADRSKLDAAIAEKADKASIEAMKSEMQANMTKQLETLNEALKQQGLAIGRIANGNENAKGEKTLTDMLTEKKADLVAIKGGENKRVKLDVKVAGTMTIGGNVTGEVPQSQREAGLNRISRRRPFVADYVNSGVAECNMVWALRNSKTTN